MKIKDVDLYKVFGVKRKDGAKGILRLYVHDESIEINPNRIRPAILVLAGGGYSMVSFREREPISMEYYVQGFNVFDLEYSCSPISYPTQLLEGCMAMAYIRDNAKKLHIDKDKVCAIGFSAGGHLLGTLSTLYNEKEVKDVLGERNVKPDASLYCYSVITSGIKTHGGSIDAVSGGKKEIKEKISIEKNIDKNSPPAFIWCTANDPVVPSENSLMLAMAYKKAGVPFELHIFEDGVHGLSTCKKETTTLKVPASLNESVEIWMPLSYKWLKNRGFLIKD